MSDEETPHGTLRPGEFHPAASSAMAWLREYIARKEPHEIPMLLESFSSVGMSGNRNAELCGETLNRIMTGQPVSDRYLLGLVWTIREMEDLEDDDAVAAIR